MWKKSFREIHAFPKRGGRSVFFVPVREGGREGSVSGRSFNVFRQGGREGGREGRRDGGRTYQWSAMTRAQPCRPMRVG